MDLTWHDKVAIVGRASKGVGRPVWRCWPRKGAKVIVCSRTQADLEQAAQEIRDTTGAGVLVFAGDLDNYDTIRGLIATTVDRFGHVTEEPEPELRPQVTRMAVSAKEARLIERKRAVLNALRGAAWRLRKAMRSSP